MEGTRILVVEDHPTMREAMRLVLEGEGYAIEEVADGSAALAAVRDDPPAVVLLDLHIPGVSGDEVLAAIKDGPETAGVRVVVVTATGEEGRQRVMELGADGYVTKPFGPATLLAILERVLSGPPPAG